MSYGFLILISITLGISMGLIGCWIINFIFLFKDKSYVQPVRIGACFICFFGSSELLNFLDEIGRGDYPDDIFMQGTVGVLAMVSLFVSMFYMERNGTARWKK